MSTRVPEFAPSQGDGKDVGAWDDREATEWAATLNDIREYGAEMDGSTDDSGAIESALADSTGPDEAAYVPADGGTVRMSIVDVTPSMSGTTLVGDGYDSLTETISSRYGFRFDAGSAFTDVTFANFRHSGRYPDFSGHHAGLAFLSSGVTGHDVLAENLWVQDCGANGIKVRMEGVEIDHCSIWGTGAWHGIANDGHNESGSNPSSQHHVFAWDNGDPDNEGLGLGIDASGGEQTVDTCLLVGNEFAGGKVTSESPQSEKSSVTVTNVHCEGNGLRGWYGTTGDGGDIHYDDLVSIDNNWNSHPDHDHAGIVVNSITNLTGGRIYAIGSSGRGIFSYGQDHDGNPVEYDLERVEVCDNGNDGLGFIDSATGSIDVVRGQGNEGSLVGGSHDVDIGRTESASCDVPDVLPDRDANGSDPESSGVRRTTASGLRRTSDSGLSDT